MADPLSLPGFSPDNYGGVIKHVTLEGIGFTIHVRADTAKEWGYTFSVVPDVLKDGVELHQAKDIGADAFDWEKIEKGNAILQGIVQHPEMNDFIRHLVFAPVFNGHLVTLDSGPHGVTLKQAGELAGYLEKIQSEKPSVAVAATGTHGGAKKTGLSANAAMDISNALLALLPGDDNAKQRAAALQAILGAVNKDMGIGGPP